MALMRTRPDDLAAARAAVASLGLTTDAAAFITYEVAVHLPFEHLARFKTLLKQFFSEQSWTAADEAELSEIVCGAVAKGWWEHELEGLQLAHGIRDGRYVLWVSGAAAATRPSLFDRVFSGPVIPEPTPHPRKVKFSFGGTAEPGTWYRRTDGHSNDARVARIFDEPDVTDVMVAGDFVTVGLERTSSWEARLDPILDLVTSLFATTNPVAKPERTREELVTEGRRLHLDVRPAELHLLDPDDPEDRARLLAALRSDDARVRRVTVAVLAGSHDPSLARQTLRIGFADEARIVRRTAVDAAADADDQQLRSLFELALSSPDAWVRWKAIRAIGALGVGSSRDAVTALEDDPDFQVRFEVAKTLRS